MGMAMFQRNYLQRQAKSGTWPVGMDYCKLYQMETAVVVQDRASLLKKISIASGTGYAVIDLVSVLFFIL